MPDTPQTRAQNQTAFADNNVGAITPQTARNFIVSVPFYTGAWSGAIAYAVNDVVTSGGTAWICLVANTNSAPTAVNANWAELVSSLPNVTGTVAIANGGTGATTASAALTSLGALAVANNLSDLNNAATARTNLALGTAAVANTGTANGNVPVISGGTIPGSIIPTLNQNTTGTAANVTGTVAIANGGTGATTAGAALTNLGALAAANNLSDVANAGTARTNLGLGTAATHPASDFQALDRITVAGNDAPAYAKQAAVITGGGVCTGVVSGGVGDEAIMNAAAAVVRTFGIGLAIDFVGSFNCAQALYFGAYGRGKYNFDQAKITLASGSVPQAKTFLYAGPWGPISIASIATVGGSPKFTINNGVAGAGPLGTGNGTLVYLLNLTTAATLTGFSNQTAYYVVGYTVGATTTTFQLSATLNGSPVTSSDTTTGMSVCSAWASWDNASSSLTVQGSSPPITLVAGDKISLASSVTGLIQCSPYYAKPTGTSNNYNLYFDYQCTQQLTGVANIAAMAVNRPGAPIIVGGTWLVPSGSTLPTSIGTSGLFQLGKFSHNGAIRDAELFADASYSANILFDNGFNNTVQDCTIQGGSTLGVGIGTGSIGAGTKIHHNVIRGCGNGIVTVGNSHLFTQRIITDNDISFSGANAIIIGTSSTNDAISHNRFFLNNRITSGGNVVQNSGTGTNITDNQYTFDSTFDFDTYALIAGSARVDERTDMPHNDNVGGTTMQAPQTQTMYVGGALTAGVAGAISYSSPLPWAIGDYSIAGYIDVVSITTDVIKVILTSAVGGGTTSTATLGFLNSAGVLSTSISAAGHYSLVPFSFQQGQAQNLDVSSTLAIGGGSVNYNMNLKLSFEHA